MAGEKRDLIVSPGEYAYLRDGTKGTIKVFTGPTVATPSAQDEGILYNDASGQFEPCGDIGQAKRRIPVAVEGFYCVLLNPAKNQKQPEEGGQSTGQDLDVGRKINIPGPWMKALWPGQSAQVIRGHQLRYNQYLVARVYNEDEARRNWGKGIMKPASPIQPPAENASAEEKATYAAAVEAAKVAAVKTATASPPPDLTVGTLLIIKGTEVSFYIPPTGISVVAEANEDGTSQYVREALTLERLEYAILLGENGSKKYVQGPTVVFPSPTEKYLQGQLDNGQVSTKFRAIELNDIQGLHLKVIADFKDEKDVVHKAGEELFITGKDTAIYYPREEVSAVKYDGKTKHFASAVPIGEGRYVLNRMTGEIETKRGPDMLLPDPRTEVIVRRVLTDRQCQDWYPGNTEALLYNQNLREILKQVPTTRGAPSEGDVERNYQSRKGGPTKSSVVATGGAVSGGLYASSQAIGDVKGFSASNAMIADSSRVSKDQGFVGDEFVRASSFTQPRALTLDTKYQGVPTVEVWTGCAVLVVSKTGDKRRVVRGPSVVLLDYDESFEAMELSRGKPKTADNLLRTVFLRTDNNQVTDIITLETSDYVQFNVKLSYRVNFEGDSSKWWSVENYVKFLCDRMRSDLKGALKKIPFTEFRPNATEILQRLVLQSPPDAESRNQLRGRVFPENNMRVTDVEVLEVSCLAQEIENTFKQTALSAVKTNLELVQLKRGLEVTKEREAVVREEAEVRASTQMQKHSLSVEVAASELTVALAGYHNSLKQIEEEAKTTRAAEDEKNFSFTQDLARRKQAEEQSIALRAQAQDLALLHLKAEAEAVVSRFSAAKDGLSEIAKVIANTDAAVEIAKALNMQRSIGGESFADAASKVLGGIPAFGPLVSRLTNGGVVPQNGSSEKKPTAQV